ncbi:MAG TPA: hypothetical protein VFS97_05800 [Nitrososphaeraceae archaeon]|nr:hypothetical protein [Nitrososphaeraceae archaeon]
MIATKRTAALIAAMSLLGAVTPAAFAQVGPQLNFNLNTETSANTCPATAILGSTASTSCNTNQEQGNCQLNVGADRESTATGSLDSGDCS